MEQRRLRLGDILDDYCPRERRVTNHAVVAMIEEDVKQTRCTTCDAEHAYKGARVPKRRKKEPAVATPALAVAVAGLPVDALPPIAVLQPPDALAPMDFLPRADVAVSHSLSEDLPSVMHSDDNDTESPLSRVEDDTPYSAVDADADDVAMPDGPVHRPLIRATLPRPEGQKDARPVPEFTVRHAPGRGGNGHGTGQGGGNYRADRERMRMRGGGNGHGASNGNRAGGNGQRVQGGRPAGPGRSSSGRSGGPMGFRNGNQPPSGKRGRGSR